MVNSEKKINHRYINCNDITLYTEYFGKQQNQACLLIAGAGASAKFWSTFLCEELAAQGYFVIRYDHRDIGLSSAINYDTKPYTVFDLATDAKDVLASFNIKHVHVVGHSMGGIIAQILAVEYPEYVRTFTSMSVGINNDEIKVSQEVMDALMQNQPSGNYETDLAGFMRSWRILNGKAQLDEEMAQNYTKDLYVRSIHKVGIAWNHINCQKNISGLPQKLSQNKIPVLFIHGKEDPLIPLSNGLENARITSCSEFKAINNMGHMFFNKGIEREIIISLLKHFNCQSRE